MPPDYKLPRCWLGQEIQKGGQPHIVTVEEINPDCTCVNAVQAFYCMEGHLSECHKGMNCRQAECGHLEQYIGGEEG